MGTWTCGVEEVVLDLCLDNPTVVVGGFLWPSAEDAVDVRQLGLGFDCKGEWKIVGQQNERPIGGGEIWVQVNFIHSYRLPDLVHLPQSSSIPTFTAKPHVAAREWGFSARLRPGSILHFNVDIFDYNNTLRECE